MIFKSLNLQYACKILTIKKVQNSQNPELLILKFYKLAVCLQNIDLGESSKFQYPERMIFKS